MTKPNRGTAYGVLALALLGAGISASAHAESPPAPPMPPPVMMGGPGPCVMKMHHDGPGMPEGTMPERMTKEQFLAPHVDMFNQIDANKDGVITDQEHTAFHDKCRAEHDADGGTPENHMFLKMDANKDGFVAKNEFAAMHDEHFAKMDANKDNKLSADEFKPMGGMKRIERYVVTTTTDGDHAGHDMPPPPKSPKPPKPPKPN